MADNKDEPSIEEILSSIRDIISEEDDDNADAQREKPFSSMVTEADDDVVEQKPEVVPARPIEQDDPIEINNNDDDDDDVLELTDIAEDDSNMDESIINEEINDEINDDPLAGIDLSHPDDDDLEIEIDDGLSDILDIDDDNDAEIEEQPLPEPVIEDIPEMPEDTQDDALVDKIAETATIGAMAKLAENIAVSKSADGTTLEDIVRELLRPMLKEWLDGNLPDIIDRLVTKELERLAEKAVRK